MATHSERSNSSRSTGGRASHWNLLNNAMTSCAWHFLISGLHFLLHHYLCFIFHLIAKSSRARCSSSHISVASIKNIESKKECYFYVSSCVYVNRLMHARRQFIPVVLISRLFGTQLRERRLSFLCIESLVYSHF